MDQFDVFYGAKFENKKHKKSTTQHIVFKSNCMFAMYIRLQRTSNMLITLTKQSQRKYI